MQTSRWYRQIALAEVGAPTGPSFERVMAFPRGTPIHLSARLSTAKGRPNPFDLLDLGEHRLRDLSLVEHLFQVPAEGLTNSFPPLKTVNAVPGNLPGNRRVSSAVTRRLATYRTGTGSPVGHTHRSGWRRQDPSRGAGRRRIGARLLSLNNCHAAMLESRVSSDVTRARPGSSRRVLATASIFVRRVLTRRALRAAGV